ncbi:beta-ketoacyl synthase N-terminal-like domain-containing protein [Streptomyces antimycoticus]|uniref:beta-ketoacyl synthase N-terminal-like domain-containing protein n=1 Tax=Streptomyces antimycoticus TaxID=68175 RepID=UPI0036CC870E
MNSAPRIFVTGLGMISPAGAGTAAYWMDLCAATPHFEELEPLYAGMKPGALGGRVPWSARTEAMSAPVFERGARPRMASVFAVYAAVEAVRDAGMEAADPLLRTAVVCVGTSDGHADGLEAVGAGLADEAASFSSATIAATVAGAVGSLGPAFVVNGTCASANVALAAALDALRSGLAEVAVVGGCDAYSQKNIIGFSSLKAIGPQPCRPFAQDRRYVTPSEGAGVLVIQTERSLGADQVPYAEVLASAVNNDARHPTAPDPAGVEACHRRALHEAGLSASKIDVIYAHGTGSRINDAIEEQIFLDNYPRATVTAVKGTVGHLMGGAGAAGAVAACLTLRHRLVPPTAVEADAVNPGLELVTGAPRAVPDVRYVQNNALGFGGNNALSIFRQIS